MPYYPPPPPPPISGGTDIVGADWSRPTTEAEVLAADSVHLQLQQVLDNTNPGDVLTFRGIYVLNSAVHLDTKGVTFDCRGARFVQTVDAFGTVGHDEEMWNLSTAHLRCFGMEIYNERFKNFQGRGLEQLRDSVRTGAGGSFPNSTQLSTQYAECASPTDGGVWPHLGRRFTGLCRFSFTVSQSSATSYSGDLGVRIAQAHPYSGVIQGCKVNPITSLMAAANPTAGAGYVPATGTTLSPNPGGGANGTNTSASLTNNTGSTATVSVTSPVIVDPDGMPDTPYRGLAYAKRPDNTNEIVRIDLTNWNVGGQFKLTIASSADYGGGVSGFINHDTSYTNAGIIAALDAATGIAATDIHMRSGTTPPPGYFEFEFVGLMKEKAIGAITVTNTSGGVSGAVDPDESVDGGHHPSADGTLSVLWFTDAGGTTPVAGGAGTAVMGTLTTDGSWRTIGGGATAPHTANSAKLKLSFASVPAGESQKIDEFYFAIAGGVVVSNGTARVGTVTATVASQVVQITGSHATRDRLDAIVVDSSGTADVIDGSDAKGTRITAGGDFALVDVGARTLIGLVYVGAASTFQTQGDIQMASDPEIDVLDEWTMTPGLSNGHCTTAVATGDAVGSWTYTVDYFPRHPNERYYVSFRKMRSDGSNTISFKNYKAWNYPDPGPTEADAPGFGEGNNGIVMSGRDNWFYDLVCEGLQGAAFKNRSDATSDIHILGFRSVAAGWDGWAWNQGDGIFMENFVILSAGRWGNNVEPEGPNAYVRGMTMRHGLWYGGTYGMFRINGWEQCYDIIQEDVTFIMDHGVAFQGGSIGGGLYNCRFIKQEHVPSEPGNVLGGDNDDMQVVGQDFDIVDCTVTGGLTLGANKDIGVDGTYPRAGGYNVVNLRVLDPKLNAEGCIYMKADRSTINGVKVGSRFEADFTHSGAVRITVQADTQLMNLDERITDIITE